MRTPLHWLMGVTLVLSSSSGCSGDPDTPYGVDAGSSGSTGLGGAQGTTSSTVSTSGGVSTGFGGTTSSGGSSSSGSGGSSTASGGSSTTAMGGSGTGFGSTGFGGSSGGSENSTESSSTTGSGGSGPGPGTKFVGNITTRNSIDADGRTFSTYWDQITPENAGKWGSVQGNASSGFNWSTLDSIYDYAENAGIIFKEHTFVWGSQQPGGSINEAAVKTWMNEFCSRYPNTPIIDVVNEPPPHTTPSYADSIGGGTNGSWQWIINAFTWAREACPNAILILNDYNNVEWADQNQHFIDIAQTVKAAGAPIDAVGAQAHGLSSGVSTQTMINLMTKLHEDTGLPVYVTEYDINISDDNQQLQRYQEHFEFFLETEWVHGITVWGWIFGSTWVQNSGLIRNGTPRPAMTWLMERLGRPAP